MGLEAVLNTDPLAMLALGGLAVTLLVTVGIFGWLITRKDGRKA